MPLTLKNSAPVIIVILTALSAGWIGKYVDTAAGNSGAQTIGTLIFLLLPLIVSLLVRWWCKDSFKTKSTRPAYQFFTLSVVWYPVTIGLSIVVALLAGVYQLKLDTFNVTLFFGIAVSAMIKNLFEEFVWRGYLTPKLNQLGIARFYNHCIVGLVWALWHIPYLTVLNPQIGGELLPYLPQFIISIIAVSWVYGELRLRSGSTWYPWLLHVINNIITGAIVLFGVINYQSGNKLIFSPFDGLIYTLITVLLSYLVYKKLFKSTNLY